MLASVVAEDIDAALRDKLPHDLEKTRAALAALPGVLGAAARRDPSPARSQPRRAACRGPEASPVAERCPIHESWFAARVTSAERVRSQGVNATPRRVIEMVTSIRGFVEDDR